LILGGYGATGRLLARHLLAETNHRIIIAGRNLEKARGFVDSLHDSRATAAQVDATDPASLRQALRRVDLILVAAPTTHHAATVVRAALDAGVDYLDVQYSDLKLEVLRAHEREINEKKLCFVTEAGYHPGLPSAMIRYAASKLDTIESARVAGYLNMGNLPYTEAVDELMEGFIHYQAEIFKNGAWTRPSSWEMRTFDFGDEIGRRTCYSMFFEELRCLPEMYPTLRNTGFYISGSNLLADLILTPIIMLGLKLAPRRGIRPLGKLMWWGMNKSRPPYRVVLKAEATGRLNGRQAQVEARIEHEDGYELTAIPVVAFLLQYNQIRRPGLHMMGHLAEPDRLFNDMEGMGVRVTTTIR
ncbi:MAG TPA: saccharopine dehydrogenase NADP-binding domain-containing protein, partial [Anaerolineales bacterium]|nr:saccharopine dehydrogenase NADP-binding domain-containing protein [Anaerolineales bacterium]